MFGWFNPAIACASRSKRCFISGFSENCGGKTLIATVRFRRVSEALYTSPMPPAPMSERISYGPRRVPGLSAIGPRLYRTRYDPKQQWLADLSDFEFCFDDCESFVNGKGLFPFLPNIQTEVVQLTTQSLNICPKPIDL